MSILAVLAATLAAVFLLGWLRAAAQIRRLRTQTELALYTSSHDRLTGLPTRETIERAFAYRAAHTLPGAIAILDLDGFKDVNDTHGHDIGDGLLVEVAQVLAAAAEASAGMVARLGGDEFLVLFPGEFDSDLALAAVIADIQSDLTVPIALPADDGEIVLATSASAGAAVFDGVHGTFATVMRHADIALYQAKKRRGSLVVYRPGMGMPPTAGRHGRRLRDRHPGEVEA